MWVTIDAYKDKEQRSFKDIDRLFGAAGMEVSSYNDMIR